jgi:hypothetical protein
VWTDQAAPSLDGEGSEQRTDWEDQAAHPAPKQGGYAQQMNFVPKPAVKKTLTGGARRRTTAFVTYTPLAGTPDPGAPATRKIKLLLRR